LLTGGSGTCQTVGEVGGMGCAARKGKWAKIDKIRPRLKDILFCFSIFYSQINLNSNAVLNCKFI
jgi:hypothetical protein